MFWSAQNHLWTFLLFTFLPLPICHGSPQCWNQMLPLNHTVRGSYLFLHFPPLSSILGALAFLSALPKIMLLWYLMLRKLFCLPVSGHFFRPSFPFVYLPNPSAAAASPASVFSSLYCLSSALSLPQKQQEAGLLMSHPLINLRCVLLAYSSWFDCCPWQR